MKKITALSIVYFVVSFLLIKGLINQNYLLQFVAKVFLTLVLLLLYFTESLKKKISVFTILMLLLVCVGQLFFIKPSDYFTYTFYCYLIMHILFSIVIYTKHLKSKSRFDIFTFSLPFFLTFAIIYILLEDLSVEWNIRALIFGPISCINGTIVILNYLDKKSKGGFLLFLGIFIWIVVGALAMVYVFNFKKPLHYNVIVVLDVIANYLICMGFVDLSKANDNDGFLRI